MANPEQEKFDSSEKNTEAGSQQPESDNLFNEAYNDINPTSASGTEADRTRETERNTTQLDFGTSGLYGDSLFGQQPDGTTNQAGRIAPAGTGQELEGGKDPTAPKTPDGREPIVGKGSEPTGAEPGSGLNDISKLTEQQQKDLAALVNANLPKGEFSGLPYDLLGGNGLFGDESESGSGSRADTDEGSGDVESQVRQATADAASVAATASSGIDNGNLATAQHQDLGSALSALEAASGMLSGVDDPSLTAALSSAISGSKAAVAASMSKIDAAEKLDATLRAAGLDPNLVGQAYNNLVNGGTFASAVNDLANSQGRDRPLRSADPAYS